MSLSWSLVCLSVILFAPWYECSNEKLRSIDLKVTPEQPAVGEIVSLTCDYDIKVQKLFGISFSKNNKYIFSYHPARSPANVVFFVHKDFLILAGEENTIQIQPLSRNASGLYTCTVASTENVSEDLFIMETSKNITVLPVTEVVGKKETQYKSVELKIEPQQPSVGDTVKITCDYYIGTESLDSIVFFKRFHIIATYPPMPTDQSFRNLPDLPNVQIIGPRYNAIEFQLRDVNDGGYYGCRVACGQPGFEKFTMHKNVTVLPTPKAVEKPEPKSKYVELIIEPQRVSVGETANMTCKYDIGDKTLISLELSKGSKVMLRYMPKDQEPSTIVTRLPGLEIIATGNNFIQFQPLNVTASATYQCVVTIGPPHLEITEDSKNLTVLPATRVKEDYSYDRLNR